MVWKFLFDPKHLFDSDLRQRYDIEALREQLQTEVETSSDLAGATRNQLEQLARRTARLELALEGLIRLLEVRKVMTREELVLMIQRIDLADGAEDGCIGPDQSARAPTCASCGLPINPHRETCIYCDAPITRQAPVSSPAKAVRTVRCTRCGATVPERDSYFTDTGLVCGGCFSG